MDDFRYRGPRPQEAPEILADLTDSDDEDIVEAVHEARRRELIAGRQPTDSCPPTSTCDGSPARVLHRLRQIRAGAATVVKSS